MDSKSLMIGNWAKHPVYGNVQIRAIQNGEQIWSPIPLTAEILEKNDWEKEDISTICVEYTFTLGCCYMMVRITNGNAYCELSVFHGPKISMNIQYVHELQHALRLCGLNNLADNFKV